MTALINWNNRCFCYHFHDEPRRKKVRTSRRILNAKRISPNVFFHFPLEISAHQRGAPT